MSSDLDAWMEANLKQCSALGALLTADQCAVNRTRAKGMIEPGQLRHCIGCEGLGKVEKAKVKAKASKPSPLPSTPTMALPTTVSTQPAQEPAAAAVSEYCVVVSFEEHQDAFSKLKKLSEETDGHSLADDILSIMLMFINGDWQKRRKA